jgi:hypothetical protein
MQCGNATLHPPLTVLVNKLEPVGLLEPTQGTTIQSVPIISNAPVIYDDAIMRNLEGGVLD